MIVNLTKEDMRTMFRKQADDFIKKVPSVLEEALQTGKGDYSPSVYDYETAYEYTMVKDIFEDDECFELLVDDAFDSPDIKQDILDGEYIGKLLSILQLSVGDSGPRTVIKNTLTMWNTVF